MARWAPYFYQVGEETSLLLEIPLSTTTKKATTTNKSNPCLVFMVPSIELEVQGESQGNPNTMRPLHQDLWPYFTRREPCHKCLLYYKGALILTSYHTSTENPGNFKH